MALTAIARFTPAALCTILIPRSLNLDFFRCRFTIRLPYIYPKRDIVPVERMFRPIFCADPAFMRLDPASTSGPTTVTMARSAAFSRGELLLHATAIVLALCLRAYSIAATVNGVRPLA